MNKLTRLRRSLVVNLTAPRGEPAPRSLEGPSASNISARNSGPKGTPRSPSNDARVAFAVPGDLDTPTGGYGYDRRIIEELRELGWHVTVADISQGFPFPSDAQRASALARLSEVPAGCPIVLDGLAFGALPEAGALACRTPLIALVHQPLAYDPGLGAAEAGNFRDSERAALAAAYPSSLQVKQRRKL